MSDSHPSQAAAGVCLAVAVGVGAALGVAMDNIPLWLSLGCSIGVIAAVLVNARGRGHI
jgi:hypothetical protein